VSLQRSRRKKRSKLIGRRRARHAKRGLQSRKTLHGLEVNQGRGHEGRRAIKYRAGKKNYDCHTKQRRTVLSLLDAVVIRACTKSKQLEFFDDEESWC
jgi:hypothetical protein